MGKQSVELGTTENVNIRATLLGGHTINKLKSATIGLHAILTEVELRFSKDGLKINQLDDSKAVLVLMDLDSDFFDTFQFDCKENERILVIDPADLKKSVPILAPG